MKELYPSTSKYAHRGVGNFSGAAPLPPVPTSAAPGSAEKLAALEERARQRQALFHPADARAAALRPVEVMRVTVWLPTGLHRLLADDTPNTTDPEFSWGGDEYSAVAFGLGVDPRGH